MSKSEEPPVAGGAENVEEALAFALRGAATAGQWAIVSQLAYELEARRLAREGGSAMSHTDDVPVHQRARDGERLIVSLRRAKGKRRADYVCASAEARTVEDRDTRQAQDLLGHAAEENVRDTAVAVRAHDDEVYAGFLDRPRGSPPTPRRSVGFSSRPGPACAR